MDENTVQQKHGLIAILDALGAASYTDREITSFLAARKRVLGILKQTATIRDIKGKMDATQFATFTFADTLLISYATPAEPSVDDVRNFCVLLRKLQVDAMVEGILFRGAVSVGTFYIEEESNTVMGQAVTDAAAWYDATDWIGVAATPHATMTFEHLSLESHDSLGHVLLTYDIPLKGRPAVSLKAINWPKMSFGPNLAPAHGPADPKAKCLWLLTRGRVPKGTEAKHSHAMAFYDFCFSAWQGAREQSAG